MYHWDLPQKLQDMGGWTNPLIIDYMVDFADLLFRLYGDKVYYFCSDLKTKSNNSEFQIQI